MAQPCIFIGTLSFLVDVSEVLYADHQMFFPQAQNLNFNVVVSIA